MHYLGEVGCASLGCQSSPATSRRTEGRSSDTREREGCEKEACERKACGGETCEGETGDSEACDDDREPGARARKTLEHSTGHSAVAPLSAEAEPCFGGSDWEERRLRGELCLRSPCELRKLFGL